MPQASPELATEWQNDRTAMTYLALRGYVLNRKYQWRAPIDPITRQAIKPTYKDWRAMLYLFHEWDFDLLAPVDNSGD